jgi:predicted ribosomally synthesized peptide with SipW-like signal peptide
MEAKKMKNVALTAGLVGVLAMGGMFAFMTDTDEKTNVFTLGEGIKDKITLTEPNFNEEDAKDVLPLETVAKDPTINNESSIDVYGFITVDVPMAEVSTTNKDGSESEAQLQELFTYTVKDGFTQIASEQVEVDGVTYTRHTYAYGSADAMTAIAAGESKTLFDNVTLINVAEGNSTEGSTQNIVVKTYAIQADNLTETSPAAILGLIQQANPED